MAKPTKEEVIQGDDLELFMDTERLLVAGGQGGGKSYASVKLVEIGKDLDFNVVVIDFDKGFAKEVKSQLGKQPDNLEYFLARDWGRVKQGLRYAFQNLGPRDWLIFEMMNSMWELAQDQYVEDVYQGDIGDYLRQLRADKEREIEALESAGKIVSASKDADKKKGTTTKSAARQQAVSYGGLEGRTDWFPIKRMHNKDVREKAMMEGDFHILGTTSLTPLSQQDAAKWPEWTNLGRRPEGEKNNIYKFDTLVVAYSKGGDYFWRTDMGNGKGKDRGGRELVKDIDVTDEGLIASYFDYHELEL